MRGYLFLPVLLSLALTGPSVRADRPARDRPQAPVVRPERLDRGIERIRPAEGDFGATVRREARNTTRTVDRSATVPTRTERQVLRNVRAESRVRCGDGMDCGTAMHGRAVSHQASGLKTAGSFANRMQPGWARGEFLLGRANASSRSLTNESGEGEPYMSPIGARKLWQQHVREMTTVGGSFVNQIQDQIEAKKLQAKVTALLKKYSHADAR